MPVSGPFGSGAFGTGVFSSQPLYSTKSMIDDILRVTGHSNPATETTKRAVVLSLLNNTYAFVAADKHWSWLYSETELNILPPKNDGTITVAEGSNTVTGVGTSFDASDLSNAARIVITSGKLGYYQVIAVDSATSLTMSPEWADPDVTNQAYYMFFPTYQLAADAESIESLTIHGIGKLIPVGTQEMAQLRATDPTRQGPPMYYTTTARRQQDGVRHIEIWPNPEQKYAANYQYAVQIMRLSDADDNYPLVPDRHRVTLYYGALAEFYRYLRDPANAQSAKSQFDMSYMKMCGDVELTDSRLRFKPMVKSRRWNPLLRGRGFRDRLAFSQDGWDR